MTPETGGRYGEVTEDKQLSLAHSEFAAKAYSISESGAVRAVMQLPPAEVQRVFKHTPPAALLEMANTLEEEAAEMESPEQKDEMAHRLMKVGILRDLVAESEEKTIHAADGKGMCSEHN